MPVSTNHQHVFIISQALKNPITSKILNDQNILSPWVRISELKELGFYWDKEWIRWTDSENNPHRVIRYTLVHDFEELTTRGEEILRLAKRYR